jgi:nitrogen fixation/metabolism regulation signal transduction histidine kinase
MKSRDSSPRQDELTSKQSVTRSFIWKRLTGSFSIATKIGLAQLLSIVIILPVVSLSIHYYNKLGSSLRQLSQRDAVVIYNVQKMRRELLTLNNLENINYLIDNENEFNNAKKHLNTISVYLDSCKFLKSKEYEGYIDTIYVSFATFKESINLLEKEARVTRAKKSSFDERLNNVREKISNDADNLKQLLTKAEKEKNKTDKDSLNLEILGLLSHFSADSLNIIDDKSSKAALQLQINETKKLSDKIDKSLDNLAQRAWLNFKNTSSENTAISIKARKNILTILVIALLLSMYQILVIPGWITKPIRFLSNMLQRIMNGDDPITIAVNSKDEIANFAKHLQNLLKKMNDVDKLKQEYIINQHSIIKRLASMLETGIFLINRNFEITLINDKLKEYLDIDDNLIDSEIGELDESHGLIGALRTARNKMDVVYLPKFSFISRKKEYWCELRVIPIKDAEGDLYRFIVSIIPLKERET